MHTTRDGSCPYHTLKKLMKWTMPWEGYAHNKGAHAHDQSTIIDKNNYILPLGKMPHAFKL